ncbi:MAG: alpha/beta hydrolase [Chloroflexi bacterium]|nr:alpha/beta hydrolase [Chloroflexota bacterium]
MPSIVTPQGVVHYEVVGSGPPAILIHGWTQAWNTWRSTIETFHKQYRLYAPDLWGFGLSDKERRGSFNVTDFIELIPQFMDALGIVKVPIMGHSMGGTTALGVALKYPERVRKVGVVGSPIDGRSLSIFLKFASNGNIAHMLLSGENQPLLKTFLRLWSPFVSRQNPQLFYDMTVNNSSGFTVESFYSSIDSLRQTDLREDIKDLQMPAMGVYGARDVIVNPRQIKLFDTLVPNGKSFYIEDAGHFPMWDTPDKFNKAFREFMEMDEN